MRAMKDKRKTLEIVEEDIVGGFKEIVQSGVVSKIFLANAFALA